jgi:hypothetical protein
MAISPALLLVRGDYTCGEDALNRRAAQKRNEIQARERRAGELPAQQILGSPAIGAFLLSAPSDRSPLLSAASDQASSALSRPAIEGFFARHR